MPKYWVNKMSVLYIKAYQTKKVLVTLPRSYNESSTGRFTRVLPIISLVWRTDTALDTWVAPYFLEPKPLLLTLLQNR